ncbi:hypothetical protein KI387_005416, partial [Taxus chinensis]
PPSAEFKCVSCGSIYSMNIQTPKCGCGLVLSIRPIPLQQWLSFLTAREKTMSADDASSPLK